MTEHTRRDTLMIAAVGAVGAAAALTPNAEAITPTGDAALDAHRQDFAWLVGRWNVQHHRLKERLLNNHEWEDFTGTSELWLTMNGLAPSKMASAPSLVQTRCAAARSSSATDGRRSPPTPPAGSKLSRPTTARPGK